MEEQELREPGSLKLSLQRAMVGEVTANLAGLQATLEGTKIIITAYFFTAPTEGDREHFSQICTYVIADYPDPFTIDERTALISQAQPKEIPWNFLRAEAKPGN
jgi:hypothetical protein